MPSGSSEEGMANFAELTKYTSKLFERYAPEARENARRLRVGMASGLTPPHRAAVGDAIGGYAVADQLDEGTLIKRLDAILTPVEREHVMAAYSVWLADEQRIASRMGADFIRERPDLARLANPAPQETPTKVELPASAASGIMANYLWEGLETGGKTPSGRGSLLATLKHGSQNDVRIREQMRASMLAALSPAHRAGVGQAIGRSFVSSTADDGTLSAEIDGLLSAEEKQRVVDAFATFVAEQRKDRSEMLKFMPDLPNIPQTAGMPNPGAILWRALLVVPPRGFVTQR